MSRFPVIVVGAGPVGLVAAACLARGGVPVRVLEKGSGLSRESRASTFHPSTLDMLADLSLAEGLIEQGLIAPEIQFRTPEDGVLAQFDFTEIADVTAHPYRLQAEQSKLTALAAERLSDRPGFELLFDHAVTGVSQSEDRVEVTCRHNGQDVILHASWLIGADGAGSVVRHSLGIEFEGFTWPERFLVLSTTFPFERYLPDLVHVNYVADPRRWHFLLRIPAFWRVMFPIDPEMSDEGGDVRGLMGNASWRR